MGTSTNTFRFLVLSILAFLAFFGTGVQAQTKDSLLAVWNDEKQSDSIRVEAYKAYIWDWYLFSDLDSALILSEKLFDFAQAKQFPRAENQGNMFKGIVYNVLGNLEEALPYFQKSLKGSQKINDLWGESEILICLGVFYDDQGDYPSALEYYNKALLIDEALENWGGMAMSLNNIGNILAIQDELERAREYYERALFIDEELGVKQGIVSALINIGSIDLSLDKTDDAIKNLERALAVNKEIEDLTGLSFILFSLGNAMSKTGESTKALEYFERALAATEKGGNNIDKPKVLNAIGNYHRKGGNYKLALNICKESLILSQKTGSLNSQKEAHYCLYSSYKQLNNSSEALLHLEQMMQLKDSIFNEENTKKLTRIEMQYDFKRKEAAIQAEQEKKDAIAEQKLKQQTMVRNGFIGGFAVVLIFAGVFFNQRNKIGKEKARSEELLLNILPEETAQELKDKGSSDAKLIAKTSVLFTDFKGFTEMSEKLSPKELVKDLHECFSEFDRICEKYGIEKIKTIGDAYMAASGLPSPSATHAVDIVKAGLEMAAFVEIGKANKKKQNLPFFEIRIGVHTGPVVAGIVGIKKFQYDIWGDTVNTAARMESSGAVGKVNISQSTYDIIKDMPLFSFESRGKIAAKGKGEIQMWFVQLNHDNTTS